MTPRSLPLSEKEPYDGCVGHMQCSVWDYDGNLVCECDGEDEGRAEAVAIVWAVNRIAKPICAHCDAPAACFGSYEDDMHPAFACDECCGHGCEDGRCERLETP
jgi:hypothetical protein